MVNKCKVCTKTCYDLESHKVDNAWYHKRCFRCKECNNVLSIKGYAMYQSTLYCKVHFKAMFKRRGTYNIFNDDYDPTKAAHTGGGSSKQDFTKSNTNSPKLPKKDINSHKTIKTTKQPIKKIVVDVVEEKSLVAHPNPIVKKTARPIIKKGVDDYCTVQKKIKLPKIISDKIKYKGWVNMSSVKVKYEDGKEVDWDIAHHEGKDNNYQNFCTICPFNSLTKRFTLIKEYAQGTNEFLYTFPSGGYESQKHGTMSTCAKMELSEESQLTGGDLIDITPKKRKHGIAEVKWSKNKFSTFLSINAKHDVKPRKRDPEELMEILTDVSKVHLERIILDGEMMLPSVQTAFLAFNYLKKNGML